MQPVKTKKKLSRADKKQIEAAIARANRTDKKGKSAQDSIPYERMWPDGICRVSDSHYTKTIQFQDINYQLSQNEDKTAIFEGWCDFLNYFDSSIHFQLSFLNLAASEETFANSISIPPHVETVVLLSKGEVDSKKIRVEFSLEDMDMSEFQDGATYPQIKDYVLEHSGLRVSNLYISQIKRKCGIEVGKNYNLPKSEDSRQPQCPPEKEKAIREAFKYFGMI